MKKKVCIMLIVIVCIVVMSFVLMLFFNSQSTHISYDNAQEVTLKQLAGTLLNYKIYTTSGMEIRGDQKKEICSVLECATFRGVTKEEFRQILPFYKGNSFENEFDGSISFYPQGENSSLKRQITSLKVMAFNNRVYIFYQWRDFWDKAILYECNEDILDELQEFVFLYSTQDVPTAR